MYRHLHWQSADFNVWPSACVSLLYIHTYCKVPLQWTCSWSVTLNSTLTLTLTLTYTQPFNSPLSGSTRVGQHQKKHSLIHSSHLSWSTDIRYQLPPSTTIHGILLVQFTCLTVLFHNLSPGHLWSSSWSGTLYFILHTFLHPIIFFSQHGLMFCVSTFHDCNVQFILLLPF